LSEPVDNPLGIVANDFRELQGKLSELAQEAKKARFELETQLRIDQATQGLPEISAQQVSNRIKITRDLFNTDEFKQLVNQIETLELQRDRLDKQLAVGAKDRIDRKVQALKLERDAHAEVLKAQQAVTDASVNRRSIIRNTQSGGLTQDQAEAAFKKRLLDLQNTLAEAKNKEFFIQRGVNDLVGEDLKAEAELLSVQESLEDLGNRRKKIEQDIGQQIAINSQKLADQDIFKLKFDNQDLTLSIKEAELAVASFQSLNTVEAAFFGKQLEGQKQQVAQARALETLERGVADAKRELLSLQAGSSDEEKRAALAVETQLKSREKQLALERQLAQKLQERQRLEEELAKLRVSGTATQGLNFGLETFIKDNQSSFNIGERFGQDLANGVTEFGGRAISESVVAAFDPSRNFNLRESLGNLALQLGQGLLTEVLKQGLASLLQSLGVGLTQTLSGAAAAATPITAAATGVTTAFSTGATVLGSATTAMTSAISAAATAALAAIGAARGAQGASTAASVAGAAGGALATGGRADKARKILFPNLGVTHRNAPGFSVGGRPRGVDSRDTIPAWLRSGEWVIRPEAVRFYGDRLFDMLNRRQLNPDALRLSGGPKTLPSPKVSFATGGRAAASSRSTSRMVVNSVNFFDEQTLDRAFASGPEALTRYSRRRRGGMRAALGIDQAP